MDTHLKSQLVREAKGMGMDLCAIADAKLVNEQAPAGFRPDDILKRAQSVVIIAHRMPAGAHLNAPDDTT
jgi:hypothetical protein